jgi:23S rRNA (guanosine2251-2'-O)-methyltransferase
MGIITGFHAIEEVLRAAKGTDVNEVTLFYSKMGPRTKKIINLATSQHVTVKKADNTTLDSLVAHLSEGARDHRGVVLQANVSSNSLREKIALDEFLKNVKEKSIVLLLNDITDPHNVGAIFRSAAQFGCDLIIRTEKNSPKDSEIVARTSAGAINHLQIATVPNLNAAIEKLKEAGFWIYGADMNGESARKTKFANKTAIVLGSEGRGIAQLVKKNCDAFVSIGTTEAIDSLNVSVAAGIILQEVFFQVKEL